MKYVGIENYTEILASAELVKILWNTLFLVVVLVFFNFCLPYVYSFILGHLVTRFTFFFFFFLFLPSTISLAVASILFLLIYNFT